MARVQSLGGESNLVATFWKGCGDQFDKPFSRSRTTPLAGRSEGRKSAAQALVEAEEKLVTLINELVGVLVVKTLVESEEQWALEPSVTPPDHDLLRETVLANAGVRPIRIAGSVPADNAKPSSSALSLQLAKQIMSEVSFRVACMSLFVIRYLRSGHTDSDLLRRSVSFEAVGERRVADLLTYYGETPTARLIESQVNSEIGILRREMQKTEAVVRPRMQSSESMLRRIAASARTDLIDLRPEHERQVEKQAQTDLGGEDEQLARRLLVLQSATEDGRVQPDAAAEIRRIGEHLGEHGGSDRMTRVAYRVQAIGGNSRLLEHYWEGICGWMD